MSVADFKWQFDSVTLCNFTPDSVEDGTVKNWKITEIKGKWEKGVSDGGAPNSAEAFQRNKQYLIKVEDHDDDEVASVIVQVMQKDARKLKHLGKDNVELAILVLKRLDGAPLPLTYESIEQKEDEAVSGAIQDYGREVTKRFDLDPGEYVIMPCTVEPDVEGEYLLRIFSEAPFESNEV